MTATRTVRNDAQHDARRAPQDFAPVVVRDCELSERILGIDGRREVGMPHRTANVLVRLHHEPLGSVAIDLPGGVLDATGVADAIWTALHEPINAHLVAFGLPAVSRLGIEGLSAADPTEGRATCGHGEMLVSVVVPTRNRAESLARCLGSLIELEYPQLEIIVVDNAPTGDETKECVERFGTRVRYVREDTPGASAARNRGLREARGAIVACTDDDVLVDRFWIRALVDCFERHPDVACVTGLVVPAELETPAQVWFERYGGFNKGYKPQLFDTTTHRRNSWLYPYAAGTFGSGNNVAFRAASLEQIGGYDCALGPGTPARAGEDLALFVEIITSGHTLAYEPRAVVRHHHRTEYDELRQQLRDYGVGLSAMLTAQSLRGLRRGLRILLCIPGGLRLLLSPSSTKNSRRGGDYPSELAAAELRGFVLGPFAYLRSTRAARVNGVAHPVHSAPPITPLAAVKPVSPRVRAHFRIPLFRNAYALIATTLITSVLGVLYWGLAARHYNAADVGRTSAVISALLLVAGIAQLNMVNVLPRFLPAAGALTRKLVTRAYAVSAVAACVVSAVFVVIARLTGLVSPGQVNWVVGAWFVVSAMAWCIFTLQDSVLAGLRQAPWIPVENGLFSSVKILLLLAFASVSQRYGLFLSLTIPVVLSLIPVNLFLFRRAIPEVETRAEGISALPEWRYFRRFVAADYTGGLFQIGWVTILPLIVVAKLGLAANAYFYVAWVVATAFDLVLSNIGVSFLVEGAHDGASVPRLARSAAKLTAALVLPAIAIVIVVAPIALGFLGPDYAAEGTLLLRLLALAAAFRAVNVLFLSLARVHKRVRQIIAVQAVTCVLGLGLAVVLLGPLGLPGAGLAVLITQAATALCVAPSLIRDLRVPNPVEPSRAPMNPPVPLDLVAS